MESQIRFQKNFCFIVPSFGGKFERSKERMRREPSGGDGGSSKYTQQGFRIQRCTLTTTMYYQGEKFDMGVPGGDAISELIDKQQESDNEKLVERLTVVGHDILKGFHFQKHL